MLIVIVTTVVVVALSLAFTLRQAAVYEASAQVLLNYQNLATGLAGIQDLPTQGQDPARVAATQTQVAMSPAVARRVVAKANVHGLTNGVFLASASVTAGSDSDTLNFGVRYSDPQVAARLANLHAREYIASRQQLDTSALVAARKELGERIDELRATPVRQRDRALLSKLVDREQELRTLEALQTANASLLRPATSAVQVQPKPVRNVILGLMLGLMLGVGIAFARDALDTRVRSAAELAERLRLPLLARLPAPRKKLRATNTLVMMADPRGHQSEAFRMLRSNLEFVNLDRGAKTILVTSALEREGKSTTVANLAVVLARAGKRVALVDLDLRRPTIGDFFGIGPARRRDERRARAGRPRAGAGRGVPRHRRCGRRIHPAGPSERARGSGSRSRGRGARDLVAGQIPSDAGELMSSPRLQRLLGELRSSSTSF